MEEKLKVALQPLNELVGLEHVKKQIKEIAMMKMLFHEKTPGHYVFMGNPGTGKTLVARQMTEILKAVGALKTGHVVECHPKDMISDYIGQTAIKTRRLCEQAIGGILFVDEAYRLVNAVGSGSSFCSPFQQEALEELLWFMEDHREELCVIFCGYPDAMERFMNTNPALPSRITKVIRFPDYSADELIEMMHLIAKKNGLELSADFVEKAKSYLNYQVDHKDAEFRNVRTVYRMLTEANFNRAKRIVAAIENGGNRDSINMNLLIGEDLENMSI